MNSYQQEFDLFTAVKDVLKVYVWHVFKAQFSHTENQNGGNSLCNDNTRK